MPAPKPDQREVDGLVRAVLQRELLANRTLPDRGLLPKRGPIHVVSPAGETVVTRRALPGGRLRLASIAELQAMADETGDSIAFVRVEVWVTGKTAEVSAGVDILLPASSSDIKMCCCKELSRWVKKGEGWQKEAQLWTRCS